MSYYIKIIFISIIFFSLYGAINYYIGLHHWHTLNKFIPLNQKIYWTIFSFIAISYLLAMLSSNYLPYKVTSIFNFVGVYWLAALFYFLLFLPVFHLLNFFLQKTSFVPYRVKELLHILFGKGLTPSLLILFLLIYGTWIASHPKITEYNVHLSKQNSSLKELNIVMLSDIHLGLGVNLNNLNKLVKKVNELNPDIVVLCGDIIDENTSSYIKKNMAPIWRKIQSQYGVYAVLGNHEYNKNYLKNVTYLQNGNIRVLQDETIKINNSFYLVGRHDVASEHFTHVKRKTLSALLENTDKSLPILLLDHQPSNLQEARTHRVDLQLSGHTHSGQIFPNKYITKRVFEVDSGYVQQDQFHVVVSSGYGTWGPPIRIGTHGEIVQIHVQF